MLCGQVVEELSGRYKSSTYSPAHPTSTPHPAGAPYDAPLLTKRRSARLAIQSHPLLDIPAWYSTTSNDQRSWSSQPGSRELSASQLATGTANQHIQAHSTQQTDVSQSQYEEDFRIAAGSRDGALSSLHGVPHEDVSLSDYTHALVTRLREQGLLMVAQQQAQAHPPAPPPQQHIQQLPKHQQSQPQGLGFAAFGWVEPASAAVSPKARDYAGAGSPGPTAAPTVLSPRVRDNSQGDMGPGMQFPVASSPGRPTPTFGWQHAAAGAAPPLHQQQQQQATPRGSQPQVMQRLPPMQPRRGQPQPLQPLQPLQPGPQAARLAELQLELLALQAQRSLQQQAPVAAQEPPAKAQQGSPCRPAGQAAQPGNAAKQAGPGKEGIRYQFSELEPLPAELLQDGVFL